MTRRIEQEILLDRRILESGLVEIDPARYMEWYSRSTGYNILRDEAVGEFFGEPVSWSDLMEALRREATTDKAKQALETLEAIDKTQAGRLRMRPEGAVPAYVLSNLAASTINTVVAPTIIGTEGSMTAARAIVSTQFYASLVNNIQDFVKTAIDSGYARSQGFETAAETMQSRVFTEFNDHLPKAVRNSRLAAGSRWLNDATRIVGGERPVTNGLKSLNFNMTYGKLWTHRRKFSKWLEMGDVLQRNITDAKEARGLARQAGLSFGDYRLFKSYGLFDPQMLDIAQRMTELDSKVLSSRRRFRDAVLQLSDEDQVLARELDRRLAKFALSDAEKLIATPSASTRAVASRWAEQPLFRLVAGFTSWMMAFQTATMSRVGTSAYNKQAAFLAMFVAGEIMNQMYRDTVYNGYSIDDAAAKWKDDPVNNMAVIITRAPVWGAFNPFAGIFQVMASGYGSGASSAFDSPALGLMDRAVNTAVGVGKKLANGEDVTDAQLRTIYRITPPINFWWVQGTRRIGSGFDNER
jgi:hypothetical protein